MLHPNELSHAKHDAIPISAPLAGMPTTLVERRLVGLTRFELVTPRLSSVCSNQLSYRPRYSLSKNRMCRFSQN